MECKIKAIGTTQSHRTDSYTYTVTLKRSLHGPFASTATESRTYSVECETAERIWESVDEPSQGVYCFDVAVCLYGVCFNDTFVLYVTMYSLPLTRMWPELEALSPCMKERMIVA